MRALLVFSTAFALLVAGDAIAHDHWINAGRYVSPIDGSHCCGDNDCFEIPGNEVREAPGGYQLIMLNEIVPFREAQISRDGNFWRCKKPDGTRRCFFAPPPAA